MAPNARWTILGGGVIKEKLLRRVSPSQNKPKTVGRGFAIDPTEELTAFPRPSSLFPRTEQGATSRQNGDKKGAERRTKGMGRAKEGIGMDGKEVVRLIDGSGFYSWTHL